MLGIFALSAALKDSDVDRYLNAFEVEQPQSAEMSIHSAKQGNFQYLLLGNLGHTRII